MVNGDLNWVYPHFIDRGGWGKPVTHLIMLDFAECSCTSLPGKSHGQRGLVGCSPWGRKESDTTETLLTYHFHALEKEMATHSSVLAWRIQETGEPGGLPSMWSHRVRHDWSDLAAAAAAVQVQGEGEMAESKRVLFCFVNIGDLWFKKRGTTGGLQGRITLERRTRCIKVCLSSNCQGESSVKCHFSWTLPGAVSTWEMDQTSMSFLKGASGKKRGCHIQNTQLFVCIHQHVLVETCSFLEWSGTSPVVQWLIVHALQTGDMNLILQIRSGHSVVSDSLRPHELQHARPPCPSPTPRVHWDSRPPSQWCHPAISSSVVPFSSCPQSLPAFWSYFSTDLQ